MDLGRFCLSSNFSRTLCILVSENLLVTKFVSKTVDKMDLKFRSKFNYCFTNDDMRQERANFFFKMFKMRFLRSSKFSKITWNSLEQPVESQKLAKEAKITTLRYSYVSRLLVIISYNIWRFFILQNSASSSCMRLFFHK